MKRLWNSLYAKVRGMAKGYVAGGAAAVAATELLNATDVTDLSSSQKLAWTLGTTALLGILNAYRTPESGPAPSQDQ